MLVSASTYTAVTGTAAPSNYADLEARVVARLSAVLGRPLQSAERVEKLTANFDGFAYPKARPVTAVEGDYDFDEHTIRIGQGSALVTYTGGWTDETVPADLAEAIAWGIHTVASGATVAGAGPLPAGISSLNIAGEYQVSVAAGMVLGRDGHPLPERWALLSDLGGRCVAAALRYRRVPL
jgi:hypothetical protein